MIKKLVAVIVVLGAAAASLAWPRVSDVETGRSPEYPDLQVREYRAGAAAVAGAAERAVASLPRWRLVGSGRGPAGTALQAEAGSLLRLSYDVTVRITPGKGLTRVSVRSRSRLGSLDLGQNARNIRRLLEALDREVRRPAGG
jgi:uncharacterized protein (DUF1499 family)